MTDLATYWRTRTISEAQEQGYTHLRAHCPGCGYTTDVPWKLVIGRRGVTRDRFIGNLRLRCSRCGPDAPDPDIGVTRQSDVPGFAKRTRD
jgi:ribosomal protein S27AE